MMRIRRMVSTRAGDGAGALGPADGSRVVVSTAVVENPWAWVCGPPSSRARRREVEELAAAVGGAVLAAQRPSSAVHCAGIVVGLGGELEDGWSLARAIHHWFGEGGRGGRPGPVVVRRATTLAGTIPSVDESGAITTALRVAVRGELQADEMAAIVVGVGTPDREVRSPRATHTSTRRGSAH